MYNLLVLLKHKYIYYQKMMADFLFNQRNINNEQLNSTHWIFKAVLEWVPS